MKISLSKTQAKDKIDAFFERKSFTKEEMKKIKRLAMKFKIRLKGKRRLFCKRCLSQLTGKIKVNKTHKTIECYNCKFKNKIKL